MNREKYYDLEIDLEEKLTDGGLVGDVFYLRDLQQRKIFLSTDIDQFSVGEAVKHIMQFNKEDNIDSLKAEERTPILLYITSNGGDVGAGFELIDVILNSKTPVYTINLGYQYSMGFLIGLAGHKRFSMPNAKFLMHDGSNFVYGSGTKVQDQMEFQKKVEKRIKDYVLGRSLLTAEEYDDKLRVEWYMFADEAKERGFTDYIIGVDCGIDCVI